MISENESKTNYSMLVAEKVKKEFKYRVTQILYPNKAKVFSRRVFKYNNGHESISVRVTKQTYPVRSLTISTPPGRLSE